MTVLHQSYTGIEDWEVAAYGANQWWAQTFTTTIPYSIYSVQLYLQRYGLPGTITIAIKAVDESGNPTGCDLATGTTDGDTLPTDTYEWREITLTAYTISEAIQYAIIIKALSGNASNDVEAAGCSPGSYSGGIAIRTTNAGVGWTQFSGDDIFFKTYS